MPNCRNFVDRNNFKLFQKDFNLGQSLKKSKKLLQNNLELQQIFLKELKNLGNLHLRILAK